MTTILTRGFETGDSTTGWTDVGGGGFSLATDQFNEGARSLKVASSAPTYQYQWSGSHGVTYYSRFYIRVNNTSGSEHFLWALFSGGGGSLYCSLRMNGANIQLFDATNNQVGSNGTITANAWHYLELAFRTTASGANEYFEARVNGVSIGSNSTYNWQHETPGRLIILGGGGSTTRTVWYDSLVINDSNSGGTWPGSLSTPATVNAAVTDIDVDGIDCTVAISPDPIVADDTNVAVAGHPATVEATSPHVTVNAEVTDVEFTTPAVTVSTTSSVQVGQTTTNVQILTWAATPLTSVIGTNIGVSGRNPTLQITQEGPPSKLHADGFTTNPGNHLRHSFGLATTNLHTAVNAVTADPTALLPPDSSRDSLTIPAKVGGVSVTGSTLLSLDNIAYAEPADNDYIIRYQYVRGTTTSPSLTIQLQNADSSVVTSLVVSGSSDGPKGEDAVNLYTNANVYEYTLTETEVGDIDDINNLRFYVAITHGSQGAPAGTNSSQWTYLNWLELQVPGELISYEESLSCTVDAEVTNVDINAGDNNINFDETVGVEVSNISVQGKQPTVSTPEFLQIGSTASDTTVNTPGTVTITTTGVTSIFSVAPNTRIKNSNTRISVIGNQFKFIPANDNNLTAVDAGETLGADMGSLLYTQQKILSFKIGNIGDSKINILLTAESVNENVIDLVEFSSDKTTWDSFLDIQNIQPNAITDVVYVRVNAGYIEPGQASFIIKAAQSNA